MPPDPTPFAALSLIVAPALLTNASSLLILSTSNRLARAVDRARDLTRQLEATDDLDAPEAGRQMHELATAERRSLLLLRALRSFYIAVSSFASAALLSLLGAVLVPAGPSPMARALEAVAVAAGAAAVGGIIYGSVLLVRETRLAVAIVSERVAGLRARAAGRV